jgi:hypothetical protein
MKLDGKCAARLVLCCGLVTLSWPSAAAASVPCESLADLALPDTTITAAAMVLERWVEDGVPPTRIVAVKYIGDQPALGIARTRPLCLYPRTAVYKGSGSTDDAASFECRRPRHRRADDDGDGEDEDEGSDD